MSHSCWRVIAAIALLAVATPSGARDNDKAQERPDAAQASPSEATPSAPPADRSADVGEPYAPDCNRPESRDDASFCVESRAALSAEQSVAISDRSFWVTLWSTVAVLLSLFFTGWAAVAAARAAKSAERSVDQNEAHARIQLRPYVFLQHFNFYWLHEQGGNPETAPLNAWRFQAVWKNTGQTPALNVVSGGAFFVIQGAEELPDEFEIFRISGNRSGSIGPGQGFGTNVEIPVKSLEQAYRGECSVHVLFFCEYDDGFPGTLRHRTETHNSFIPIAPPDKRDAKFLDRIQPRFNGCDAECEHQPERNDNA